MIVRLCALALFALVALGCQAEPEPLGPGQCRTDVDCPGGERCVLAPGETVGRCGCFEDTHCPGTQTCDREARRCGCTRDGQCPAGLVCRDGACLCESDVQCDGLPCERDADCPDGNCDTARGVCHSADPDDLPACLCAAGGICVHDGDGPYDPDRAPTCNVDARSTQNACGGRGPLVATDCGADDACAVGPIEAGETCGAGDWGRWTCTGCDTPPRCCRPDAAARLGLRGCCRPEAGEASCDALTADRPATADGRAVCCPPDHVLDPCGACIGPTDDRFAAIAAAVEGGATVGDPCRSDRPGAAPAGVWRCEDAGDGVRATCVACAEGTEPNACGGCEALDRISAVDDQTPIGREDIGAVCGGDGDRYGFRTTCPGVLTCIDARQVACTAPVPGRRCPGHCGEVEVARARDAGGGVCLLDSLDVDAETCRTMGEVAGAPSGPGVEGDGNLDSLRDGAPCGPCGDGRWSCTEGEGRPRLTCDGADEAPPLNICGQCGGPPQLQADVVLLEAGCLTPGCPCQLGADQTRRGELECDAGGLSLLVCVTGETNACGGPDPLVPGTAAPGARCGPASAGSANRCASWFWECDGVDRIVCVDRDAPPGTEARLNRCGGCAPLTSSFGGAQCPDLVGVTPVCLADLSGEVCIYRDNQLPPAGQGDNDNRCNCLRRDAATGGETVVRELCRYLVDSDGDGTLDQERRCDDPDPFADNCGTPGATCCVPSPEVPACADPSTICRYDVDRGVDLCVACGEEGQPCCGGALCQGVERLRCEPEVNVCEQCGDPDEPCCDGDDCNPGSVCAADLCVECGALGDPCCADDVCDAGGVCLAGACAACGESGAPCCAGRVCDDGATCVGGPIGQCEDCGGEGDPCCPGFRCDGDAICDPDDTCRAPPEPDAGPEPDAAPDAEPDAGP